MDNSLTIGSEALLDLTTWVIIDDIQDGEFVCLDQDGGEHIVGADRLDKIR